ncbi:hypothetical protein HMPREF0975_02422 [Actinomyces sp. oral taxon 849 str. F0330]|nr:hypothetical protein HMPREF0975_02422 [Actinomyces sp. oral taxon 849 str. F0330]
MGVGFFLIRRLQAGDSRTTGEVVQVRRLDVVEPQDPGQGVEHLGGGATRLPLLEPGVVTRAQPGQLGQLLTPQARNSPSRPVGAQPESLRRHPVPAGPQERSQRLTGNLD